MIQKEITVEIARSPQSVFGFLDDPAKTPRWSGLCVSLTPASPGPWTVGTKLHYVYRQGGKNGEMEGVVTARVQDEHMALHFSDKMFKVTLNFWLSASPVGTSLKHRTEIEPKGILGKLMSAVIGPATEKQLVQDMERLKGLLETPG